APPNLKGVFVGGGELRNQLYLSATRLGWPLLPTYGMTEACSQVATALPGSQQLKVLEHVQVFIGDNARIGLKGESMARSAYEWREETWVLKPLLDEQEVYWTQDCGEIEDDKT